MKIVLVASVIGLLLSCAPDKRASIDSNASVFEPQDDLYQVEDVPGILPANLPSPKSTTIRTPRAWLEPNPSQHKFIDENPFWATFTVRTSSDIDSVFVLVNPEVERYTEALEVAGGREPPFRNFCPAEYNDSPTRERRNGWNLHLSACKMGPTEVILYGWKEGRLDIYNSYLIVVR